MNREAQLMGRYCWIVIALVLTITIEQDFLVTVNKHLILVESLICSIPQGPVLVP